MLILEKDTRECEAEETGKKIDNSQTKNVKTAQAPFQSFCFMTEES